MNKAKEVNSIFGKALRKSGQKNGLSLNCSYIKIRMKDENDINLSLRDSSRGMKHIQDVNLTSYLSMLQMAFTDAIGNKIKEILRQLALVIGKNVNDVFILTFIGVDIDKKEVTRYALYSENKFVRYVDQEIKEFLK